MRFYDDFTLKLQFGVFQHNFCQPPFFGRRPDHPCIMGQMGRKRILGGGFYDAGGLDLEFFDGFNLRELLGFWLEGDLNFGLILRSTKFYVLFDCLEEVIRVLNVRFFRGLAGIRSWEVRLDDVDQLLLQDWPTNPWPRFLGS